MEGDKVDAVAVEKNDDGNDNMEEEEEEEEEYLSPERGNEAMDIEDNNNDGYGDQEEEEDDEEEEEELDATKVVPVKRVQWWTNNSSNTTSSSFDFEKRSDGNENVCAICGNRGELVCCDGPCKRSFHLQCLNILPEELPEGKWICANCEDSKSNGVGGRDALPSPRTMTNESRPEILSSSSSKPVVSMTPEKKIMKSVVGLVDEMSTQNVNKNITEAVIKGINYMIQITEPRENFQSFGSELLQLLLDLCVVAGPGIRDLIFPHVERLSVRWKQINKDMILEGVTKATRIVRYALGVQCLERVAMSHQLKKSLETSINKAEAESRKYLGFDVNSGPPTQNGSKSARVYMLTALKRAHVLDALDYRIGAKYADVFKWIKVARPYYQRDQMKSLESFREQTELVVGVVMTLTNYGKLQINPSMLPYEYEFLSKNETFEFWMNEKKNCGMVGDILHACVCLGIAEDNETNPPMVKARKWLLSKQREDGGWVQKDVSTEEEEKKREELTVALEAKKKLFKMRREFAETSACVRALVRSNFVGFGPHRVEMLDILRSQAATLRAAQNLKLEPKMFPCGVSYSKVSSLALAFVKHQYEDGGAGTSDGLPLAERGSKRLDELLLRRREKIIALKNQEMERKRDDRYMPRRKRRRRRFERIDTRI